MDPEAADSAADVAAPARIVELVDLKALSGRPFRVLCERVPEEVLVTIFKTLPGHSPSAPELAPDDAIAEKERRVRLWLSWAPAVLAQGTALRLGERVVRPAFYDGDAVPGAVPLRYLTARDRSLLMAAILELSGWAVGGAADAAKFHDRDGAGSADGAGAVDAGEGQRTDAVGSPA